MPFRNAFESLQRAQGEDDVRDALHDALQALGASRFALEYPLASGPVDMASEEHRVLIETKARGAVGPLRPGAASEETQKDQAERYLRDANDLWLGETLALHGDAEDRPKVFLTDGLKWWGYALGQTGRLEVLVSGFRASSRQALADFLNTQVVPPSAAGRRRKLRVPDDLIGQLLSSFASDLESVYRRYEGSAQVQTKIALWRECLRGAGIVPPDDEPVGQASLFVRHTVLVIAARTLKLLLRDPPHEGAALSPAAVAEMAEGFPAWLAECAEGPELIGRIAAKLDEYQWRGDTRDRLKEAYHKLIARKERKEFGEYYTPDWLAEKVVAEVLDEDWMAAAVKTAARPGADVDGFIVLDPACGSGMFLFHAARRLYRHIRERQPKKLPDARRIIARLVVGIDVHPIAVEMAEATLETALPPPADEEQPAALPQVFLGDAMQAARREDLSRDVMTTASARGRRLTLPTALAVHADSDALIERLVAAAVEGRDVAFPEVDQSTRDSIAQTLQALTRIVEEESNHVWVWHLRNIAGPVRMAHMKAGRIVANPPWLMANDTPEGTRKSDVAQLRDEYGLRNASLKHRGSSTAGDLAAVFVARTAHLYLANRGQMGLVLPGGTLINQNWEPWRSGCWHSPHNPGCHANLIRAWALDEVTPPPFPHAPSGSCVVFAERLPGDAACRPDQTTLGEDDVGWWRGAHDNPKVVLRASHPKASSDYVDDWRIGALSKPHGLFYVLRRDAADADGGSIRITTKESTKAPWKGLSLEATVEAVALRELARPQCLRPFSVVPDAYLIAPLVRDGKAPRLVHGIDDDRFRRQLPKTLAYWRSASAKFLAHRSPGAGKTLLENLDYKNTLSMQLAEAAQGHSRRTKVVYNESGNALRAARCSPAVIASGSLYWFNAATEDEALYLCGVVNAQCMQAAWQTSKTSKRHFDKSPWRAVPVPRFDASDPMHQRVSASAKAMEAAVQEPSAGEREGLAPRMKEPSAGEREGLAPRMKEPSAGERETPPRMKRAPIAEEISEDDGVAAELDDAVAALLGPYARM